jgi:CRP-like cAMP-binding protein
MSPLPGGMTPEMSKLLDCLHSVDFFYYLKREELDKLVGLMRKRSFPAGSVIIKQGEFGNSFYLIYSGKVSVWNGDKLVATRHQGDYFGESALVTEAPRSATVKADVETELYILFKEDFQKILMSNQGVASNLKSVVAERKVDADGKPKAN